MKQILLIFMERISKIMKDAVPQDDRIHIASEKDLMFEFQDIGDRYQGSTVIMYVTVEAHQEPWIRSRIRREIVNALIKEKVEFQREAPR